MNSTNSTHIHTYIHIHIHTVLRSLKQVYNNSGRLFFILSELIKQCMRINTVSMMEFLSYIRSSMVDRMRPKQLSMCG